VLRTSAITTKLFVLIPQTLANRPVSQARSPVQFTDRFCYRTQPNQQSSCCYPRKPQNGWSSRIGGDRRNHTAKLL